MQFLERTDLLVLRALETESACRFVWSEVVTPNAVPPRAIWLPGNKEKSVSKQHCITFDKKKHCLVKLPTITFFTR